MIDPRKESRIGCTVLIGVALIPVGLILTLMFYGAGAGQAAVSQGSSAGDFAIAGLGIGIALLGSVMALGGLVAGLKRARGPRADTPVQVFSDCQVIARFCISRDGIETFTPEPGIEYRYFVRLAFPGERRGEFRCAAEVFDQAMEGVRGTAYVQGDWLTSFAPAPRVAG